MYLVNLFYEFNKAVVMVKFKKSCKNGRYSITCLKMF